MKNPAARLISDASRQTHIHCLIDLIAVLAIVAYFLIQQTSIEADRPRATLDAYLRATYARNFAVAYDYLSSADRQVRTRQNYIDSQGGYSGFTLEVARQLAGFMEIWSIDRQESGGRLIMKVGYRVPAPAELNELLLHWDEDALERPLHGRAKRNRCRTQPPAMNPAKLLNIEGQETVELIEEARRLEDPPRLGCGHARAAGKPIIRQL